MALKRYTYNVDGTIPISALLYEDEVLLSSQDSVGIYDGQEKSPHHQAGTVHSTTHRLFYIDSAHPYSRSFSLDYSQVARTDHYAGLFTSSAKITLHLIPHELPSKTGTGDSGSTRQSSTPNDSNDFWTCEVCNNNNPVGLSSAASLVCSLCGVPRTSIKAPIDIPARSSAGPASSHHLSTSLPSSSVNLSSSPRFSSPLSSSPLAPEGSGPDAEIACAACTFLNSPLLTECEICGTPLPKRDRPPHPPAKSAPTSRPHSPVDDDDDDDGDNPDKRMIRLSFRRGGDKPFYAVLRRSLLGKAWETKVVRHPENVSGTGPSQPFGRSGINGILRSVETTHATSQSNMEDALEDLEALMVKWKDMVKLAQDLNERLTAGAARAVEPEEATFIRSSLAQLGLQMSNAPVTQDMVRDERRWFEELARELAGVLEGGGRGNTEGIMRRRGIVGLDEVWGGWNRARGVALIPPATFLQVLPLLAHYTNPPVRTRAFASSGLSVLHTPPYTRAAFAARLVGQLTLAGPRTTVEVAQDEALPIALIQEMLAEVESDAEICRDDGGASGFTLAPAPSSGERWAAGPEVRWWPNVFRAYRWDGQE